MFVEQFLVNGAQAVEVDFYGVKVK